MKNLLLILLLANILYFLWGWFARDEAEPGVAVITDSDLGPPLSVAQRPGREAIARVGAVLGSLESSGLAAIVGRACVTIGPFRERGDADSAQTRYAGQRMRTQLRETAGQIFVGHWVQIRNIPSRDESNRILSVLAEGGLPEAYAVDTDDEGLKISLGLFGSLESAEKVELQAQSLGFDADITPRLRDGQVFFVDVGLPPGKGAGDIIERYGEEQVMLRDRAVCPPGH